MNCVILDDEKNCVEVLAYQVKKIRPELEIIGEFTDAEIALEFLSKEPVDILFLDIEMPRMNAFQLLEKISDLPKYIIFTTAYDHYAIKAFRYYALDYLLKPIDNAMLSATLEKAYNENALISKQLLQDIYSKIKSPNSVFTKIAVPIQNGYKMLLISDIIRCEADSNYANIVMDKAEPLLISKPLKYLENLLETHGFIRVHQSHLININYLSEYTRSDGGSARLTNGEQVLVSRNRKAAFEAFLASYRS